MIREDTLRELPTAISIATTKLETNLHVAPGSDALVQPKPLPKGTEVTVYYRQKQPDLWWAYVRTPDGKFGFVADNRLLVTKELTVTEEPPAPAPAETTSPVVMWVAIAIAAVAFVLMVVFN